MTFKDKQTEPLKTPSTKLDLATEEILMNAARERFEREKELLENPNINQDLTAEEILMNAATERFERRQGERLKKLRLELNLTQEQLAKRVGYKSASTIAKIESGKFTATDDKLWALATELHTNPSYLSGYIDDRNSYELDPPLFSEDNDASNGKNTYYFTSEVADLAQELNDHPELKALFLAVRKITKEDLEMITNLTNKLAHNNYKK